MNVLVTGGAGYFGSQLVPALVRSGHTVKVIDSLIFGSHGLRECLDLVTLEQLDIRELRPMHLSGYDAVIHLAGISNDPTAEYDPQANKSVNFQATVKLAKLARECGVRRFIFASSCSVYYTEQPDNILRDELYPVNPTAPYSWSKRQAEIQLLNLATADFCPVILRKGTIFGFSERMRFDLVINTFTRDAFANGCLTVHGEGKMWRPLLYIEDAVAVYNAMLLQPENKVRGQVFNVLNDNYQVIDIAHKVQEVCRDRLNVNLNILRGGSTRSYRVDGSKLRSLLGAQPGRSIDTAVKKMWDELEKGISYDDDIYYNIRWFESLYSKKLSYLVS